MNKEKKIPEVQLFPQKKLKPTALKKEVVIVGAKRTAIGKFQGALAPFSAPQLGKIAIIEAILQANLKEELIDEVILGNVVSAGIGQNPARQAALLANLPDYIGALTINKVCGSGLKAVALGVQAIQSKDAEIIVAGGMESMSNTPYLLEKARTGYRLGHSQIIDSMIRDGLCCAFYNFHMGLTAELVAEKYNITRNEQDKYAYLSHQKTLKSIKEGNFKREIAKVEIPKKRGGAIIFEIDESPREDTDLDSLAKLKPAFKKDGTVTAGNAPSVNDGAAALILMTKEKAISLGIKPMAKIIGYHSAGVDPAWVMLAPIPAIRGLLQKINLKINDFDLIELNEAFAVQALAVGKELNLSWDKVNVHGGAVALGHPIGASGARILVTLIYALEKYNKKLGLAALCLGGGNAIALAVERI
ncbi:MAG: acetyl-CoA C-acetyltransferase [Armatimonadetes bacterium]|nr:acetyl-CoA C-acetyltransferase [Armatimonadota bacterium]